MDIIKPNNDNRIYKYFTLNNNIKCILINDNSLDKSQIVTSINIGSFGNKDYYEGMAHLLEHMCFITSNKYKKKNFLAKKVSESGGHINAFTAETNTIFYFDVFQENLEEIIEIFIDFLTNAELKKEYILSELENVDAEHKKNIFNDNWRLDNLEKLLANKLSNYYGFTTGSKETLNKPDIHKKMVNFYQKYYVANNISICIASNHSIDELYNIVNKTFGMINKTNIVNDFKLIKPLYTENKGKQYIIKSYGSTKILQYLFETPENIIKSNIFDLFIKIVCSPEDNLCVDHLKSLGYINFINGTYELYGLVKITITLTNKGQTNILYIDNFMYNYFNQIMNLDWFSIFENEKKKNLFLFNNLSKIDTMELCIDFLLKLNIYEPQDIYISNYKYFTINQSDIKMLKECINMSNCIKFILTDNFILKNNKLLIDPYYDTKYYESTHFQLKDNINLNIKYDLFNPYSNIKPKFIDKINICPKEIKKNYWYGATSKFKESNVYFNITFSKKDYFKSVINNLLTDISIQILNYYLYKKMYKAIEYNFDVDMDSNKTKNSIEINLYTFNDSKYIQKFIDDIFNLLFNKIEISDDLIKSTISIREDNIKNIISLNSWDYCDYIFSNSFENSYHYDDLLKKIKNISANQIRKYIKTLFDDAGICIFIYGNLKENDLPTFAKLNMTHKLYAFPKLKIKKKINCKHPNKNEKTNCVQIAYFIGKFNPINILHFLFLKLISYDIFFEDLRTTKKLGYLVTMYGSMISNKYYIYQKIQSELSCNKIIKHINIFNETLIDNVKKENFDKWKKTVTNHLTAKEINMNELYNKYFSEIFSRDYLFDRSQILLKHINEISIESLIKFIKNKLLNNKIKNIVQIY